MLTNGLVRAAGKYALIAFWAVLFCSPVKAQDNQLSLFESGLNDLIYRLSRSVVTVETIYPRLSDTRPGVDDAVFNVIATGVIYDSLGHVLTVASSVVGRTAIQIRFEDQAVAAEVTGIDYQTGLAMLTMSKPLGVPVSMSFQHGCAGQLVFALGNAYGMPASPSMGFCAGVRPDGIVQFTAPITSGTLGGGLFDLSGRLVGIISGGVHQDSRGGIGLAIPSSEITQAAQYLLARGDRYAGYLGLSTTEIEIYPPLEISRSGQLLQAGSGDLRVSNGVVVTSVVASSPAARAGLRKGDLLFSVNQQRIPGALELANLVKQAAPGSVIEFGVIRQNRSYSVPVKVGQVPIQSVRSSLSVTIETTESSNVTDSLLREIEVLKQTIENLEERLRRLR